MQVKLNYTTEDCYQEVKKNLMDLQECIKIFYPDNYNDFKAIYYCNFRPYLFNICNWTKQVKLQVKYHGDMNILNRYKLSQFFLLIDGKFYIVDKLKENYCKMYVGAEYGERLTEKNFKQICDSLGEVKQND